MKLLKKITNIPNEYLDLAKISIIDNDLIFLENYKQIKSLTDEELIIDNYRLKFESFVIKELNKYELLIYGKLILLETISVENE